MSERLDKYKALITEARKVYESMDDKEIVEAEAWLDSEYNKIQGSEIDSTILSQI
jgi:hypothetical protein